MNGMDRIKERILEDARQEANKIITDAQNRADELIKKNESEAAAVQEKQLKENEIKGLDLKRRMISVAQLDMRKEVLKAKQDMIDKAFEQCLSSIVNMSAEEYRALIEELMVNTVQTGNEEVIFSHRDDERLGSDFIAGVNGRLASMGKKGDLKASTEKGSFNGGFILRSGGIEINNSFESVLRIIREEIEPQVAEILFKV